MYDMFGRCVSFLDVLYSSCFVLFCFTVVIYDCIFKKSLYSKYTYWHKYVICFKPPGRRMGSKCETLLPMLLLFSRVWYFCNSMDCNSPDFSVHRTSQARILEWVVIPPPRHLLDLGIKLMSPALQVDSLPLNHLGSPLLTMSWL